MTFHYLESQPVGARQEDPPATTDADAKGNGHVTLRRRKKIIIIYFLVY